MLNSDHPSISAVCDCRESTCMDSCSTHQGGQRTKGDVRRSLSDDQSIQDHLAQGVAEVNAKCISTDQERCLQAACCPSFCGRSPVRTEESQDLHLCTCVLSPFCCRRPVEVQPNPDFFVSDKKESRPIWTRGGMAKAMESQTPYLLHPLEKNNLKTSSKAVFDVVTRKPPALLNSSLGFPPGTSCISCCPASPSSPERIHPLVQCPPGASPAQGPDHTYSSPAVCCFPVLDTQ
ncbi:polycystin-1-like protein 1, partial [Dipodomys merriami]|uniref:polycystin-1-like protein 1 n=1 Tax=Dipodomys merriami TaxID=94247 RepID=UPI003855D673